MALSQDSLKSTLEQSWLVPDGGSFPDSPAQSADKFATAVVGWFASAMAGTFPCSTAAARRPQLVAGALGAFQANDATAAGSQLALAVAAYITGQLFGATGVAPPPLATSAAGSLIGAVFADLDASRSDRAQRIASACTLLATTTIVPFLPPPAPPPPPAPIS